ncbi:hypothetical protein DPMN_180649 [Dreissena polymorpha]|uniref:Uncharacterized protein n=1 Tax=Dreissena polymorpha TaxID=45954 RepID=A0A9D4EGJ1_DREPO|nr:hypothetical protein DPMN_180649 [Dreissena polymorpha]
MAQSVKYLGATQSKHGTSNSSCVPNKTCHGDRSKGQAEQVVDKQLHQHRLY